MMTPLPPNNNNTATTNGKTDPTTPTTATMTHSHSQSQSSQPTSSLLKILPIWFQAFEIMRGYSKIKSNIEAFIKIYKLHSPILSQIQVDGDQQQPLEGQGPGGDEQLIITRSMSKKLKLKFIQIPVPVKLIKLLLQELRFQISSFEKREKVVLDDAMDVMNGGVGGGVPGLMAHSGSVFSNHSGSGNAAGNGAGGDDEGWEDVDDLPQ
ncbi:unnamed protein product [Ambrosiozyma monospora]|uniref:Unnamed protein product n=1 Tax=Ambrosiozyma monospora TaxID=43982 RepID=A0ACB5UB41_AMBMO|nr:unnamed protein product [Ambrosiozyma monospora]